MLGQALAQNVYLWQAVFLSACLHACFDIPNMKDKRRDETRNVSLGEALLMHVVEARLISLT